MAETDLLATLADNITDTYLHFVVRVFVIFVVVPFVHINRSVELLQM